MTAVTLSGLVIAKSVILEACVGAVGDDVDSFALLGLQSGAPARLVRHEVTHAYWCRKTLLFLFGNGKF